MSSSDVFDVAEALKLDESSFFVRKAYVGLTPCDESNLYSAQACILKYSDKLTGDFYNHLVNFDSVSEDFRRYDVVSILKESQKRYIARLFSGIYDFDYALDRLSFGLMYEQIGITSEWYVGAFSFYINAFSEILSIELSHDKIKFFDTLKALSKIVFIDISLAFDAYEYSHSRDVLFARDEAENLYQEQTKRIEHLAFYDALTNLPNRNLLKEKVNQLLTITHSENRLAALVYIDVINLKEVNDTLGHYVGDELIHHIGQRLLSFIQFFERDDCNSSAEALTVARITGDEFCIACLVENEKVPLDLVQFLDEFFLKPFSIDKLNISVRNRYGVVLSPKDGDSFEELLRHADIALHQAKNNPSRVFFYDDSLGKKLSERADLARRLEIALDKNEGLELRFQPQIDLSNGLLIGAEVLLRWYDSELGWVSPAVFIPLAEDRGFIDRITQRVVEMAARQSRVWKHEKIFIDGPTQLKFSVNISARDLDDVCFLNGLLQKIDCEGVKPEQFEFELTETSLMRDPDLSIKTLHHIKEKGFSLAIDDFGTGHSSLSYLRNINADLLKIDMSFVHNLDTDEDNKAIIRTIIATANIFGMKTLAEGVETVEVAQVLNSMGCDYGQGYFFSHPLTALEFEKKWLY